MDDFLYHGVVSEMMADGGVKKLCSVSHIWPVGECAASVIKKIILTLCVAVVV